MKCEWITPAVFLLVFLIFYSNSPFPKIRYHPFPFLWECVSLECPHTNDFVCLLLFLLLFSGHQWDTEGCRSPGTGVVRLHRVCDSVGAVGCSSQGQLQGGALWTQPDCSPTCLLQDGGIQWVLWPSYFFYIPAFT